MTSKLSSKVIAVNRANSYANEIYVKLSKVLEPFIGKKVENRSGSLVVKLCDAIDSLELNNTHGLRVSRTPDEYNLYWRVYASEVEYSHTADVYVGVLQDGILVRLSEAPGHRADYTVDEVVKLREDFFEKRKAYEVARNAIDEFGEHDL